MSTTKCNVCKRKVEDGYVCEACGYEHHSQCSGEVYEGSGEYPSEDAYAICKKCVEQHNKQNHE